MKLEFDFHEFTEFANNLSNMSLFDKHMRTATRNLAKALLKRIKGYTPALDYDLIHAWDKNKFLVTEVENGYEVLLVNDMIYATWVNDGHRQRPGRFIPGYWQSRRRFVYVPNYPGGMVLKKNFVKGRFFVEKGIVSFANVAEIEQIIMNELQKWWDSL